MLIILWMYTNRLPTTTEKIEQANRADECETEEFGEQSDRGGIGAFGLAMQKSVCRLIISRFLEDT